MWLDFKIPTLQEFQQMAGTTNTEAVARLAYQYATPDKLLKTLGFTDDKKGNLHADLFEIVHDYTTYTANNRWLMQGQTVHINVVGKLWNDYCDVFQRPLTLDEVKAFTECDIENTDDEASTWTFNNPSPAAATLTQITRYQKSSPSSDLQCTPARENISDAAFNSSGEGFILKTYENGDQNLLVYKNEKQTPMTSPDQFLKRSKLHDFSIRHPNYLIIINPNEVVGFDNDADSVKLSDDECKKWIDLGFDWLSRTTSSTRVEELAKIKSTTLHTDPLHVTSDSSKV